MKSFGIFPSKTNSFLHWFILSNVDKNKVLSDTWFNFCSSIKYLFLLNVISCFCKTSSLFNHLLNINRIVFYVINNKQFWPWPNWIFFYLAKISQGLSIIKVNRREINFLTYFLHILSFTCGSFIERSLIDVLEVWWLHN